MPIASQVPPARHGAALLALDWFDQLQAKLNRQVRPAGSLGLLWCQLAVEYPNARPFFEQLQQVRLVRLDSFSQLSCQIPAVLDVQLSAESRKQSDAELVEFRQQFYQVHFGAHFSQLPRGDSTTPVSLRFY